MRAGKKKEKKRRKKEKNMCIESRRRKERKSEEKRREEREKKEIEIARYRSVREDNGGEGEAGENPYKKACPGPVAVTTDQEQVRAEKKKKKEKRRKEKKKCIENRRRKERKYLQSQLRSILDKLAPGKGKGVTFKKRSGRLRPPRLK